LRRVLVTGASGLIGSNVLQPLLSAGFEVHAVSRDASGAPALEGVAWHSVDLLDERSRNELLRRVKPTHLLHFAWFAEPGAYWEAPQNIQWMAASVGLLEQFAAVGGKRAVFAGSCAEYRWGSTQPIAEDAALGPDSLYGVCKGATRVAVESIGRLRGLEVAWGRIFFLYGPGEDQRRLVASVAHALALGKKAQTSAGTQIRDFMHVRDLAGAFVALLDSDVTGAINMASGEGVTVKHVVELLGAAAERPDLLEIGAVPPRVDDPQLIVADSTRLRNEVGYVPSISLEEGLTETLDWWKSR